MNKKTAKRILDLLFIFCLMGGALFAESIPDEGYSKTFFKVYTIGASATGSFQITEPVARYSIYLDQSASFTFRTTAAVVKDSSFDQYVGSTSLELQPRQLSDNMYLWIDNGAASQTIRIKTFGK